MAPFVFYAVPQSILQRNHICKIAICAEDYA